MINIVAVRSKRLYQAEFNRQMITLENTFLRELRPLLGRQFFNAAALVQASELNAVDHAVDLARIRLVNMFRRHYKRVAASFSRKAYKILDKAQGKSIDPSETKSPKDEFWLSMNKWSRRQTATKIRGIQTTTKKVIAKIIRRGQSDGESHREIAKRIRKTSAAINPHRARTIALTETHGASVKSVDVAVASTRIEMEREWVSAKDLRTRTRGLKNPWEHYKSFPRGADGEKVAQDGLFKGTGQALRFPGDPRGSAGNIIRCRCVLIYHSVKRTQDLKPYEPEDLRPVIPDLPSVKGIQPAFKKAEPYLRPDDVKAVYALDEENFLKIPGIVKGDKAFYNSKTKEMFFNEFGLVTSSSPQQVVAHEIGHAVANRIVLTKEQKIIAFWEKHKSSLSGIQRESVSEGIAELFAIRVIDPKRFIRIAGKSNIKTFDSLMDARKLPKVLKAKPTKWKPVMSKTEADEWGKDSVYKETLYHGTKKESLDSIEKIGFSGDKIGSTTGNAGMLGRGHYFAEDIKQARHYTPDSTILETKINVKNLMSEDEFLKLAKEKDFMGKLVGNQMRGPDILKKEIMKKGYDSVIFQKEIVVFDAKNIIVLE